VLCSDDNWESVCGYYLEHADEREAIMKAADQLADHLTFQALWDENLAIVDDALTHFPERHQPASTAVLLARLWSALHATGVPDPTLKGEVMAASTSEPKNAELQHLLALLQSRLTAGEKVAGDLSQQLERIVLADANRWMAQLNLVEALASAGQTQVACQRANRLLAKLNELQETDASSVDAPHWPPGFDWFRVAFERAAWRHAGQPVAEGAAKRCLICWRLHTLLAQVTGDVVHAYEAVALQPEMPASLAGLGTLLAQNGHPLEALPYLQRAAAGNPLDRAIAYRQWHTLGIVGSRDCQQKLIEERRSFAAMAPQLVPAEGWLAGPAGEGELVSIIIPCCNEAAYTRLCVESVLRHTRAPYELILVDNGSTDDTPALLDSIRTREGPARVSVIRNETNRGFPAACNQALADAHGQHVVLLNNDTVVTPNWLEGLLAGLTQAGPDVGLVGATTNYAPEPQNVKADYAFPHGLAAFAEKRRNQFAGQFRTVPKLSGFCLLLRRHVLNRIGTLDERFGVGFFDDDDLCLRARQAGFKLAVALDVYIHHFGSRTFQNLKVDTKQLLQTNLAKFQQKWGPEATQGYQIVTLASQGLPTTVPAVLKAGRHGRNKTVALTMIVRDEERNLQQCLPTIADVVDHIVIADTGSKDNTRAIAARFGARVVEFPWIDHFAAARNEALRHATSDWILWLDADDTLDSENRQRLMRLLAQLGDERDAYAMKVRSKLDAEGRGFRLLDQVRLFPNHPQIRWDYRVHEQILPAVRRRGGNVRWSDVIVDHGGYVDRAVRRRKLERNLRLLRLDDAERPNDAFTLFNLGWTLLDLEETSEAVMRLRRSLALATPDSSIVRKLYVLLVQAYRVLGQREQALQMCREGRQRCPDDLELPWEEALLLRDQSDISGAVNCLHQLLAMPQGQFFASVDPELRSVRVQQLLAELHHQQGQLAEAEARCQAALRSKKSYVPAWLELANIYLAQQRWAELESVALGLETEAGAAVDAALVRARGQRARREFAAARTALDAVITRHPKALSPRVLLSHVLIEDGSDWQATEQALRAVLELAPDHKESQHNLAVLLRRQGRTNGTV
jgi:GT2 family glycosyltransferase